MFLEEQWKTVRFIIVCFTVLAMTPSCAPSSDVTFDDAQPVCGDSLCLETRGVTEGEVYLGGACEVGTGEGTDLSACCPEGYDAVGYCDVTEHIVACVVACDDV